MYEELISNLRKTHHSHGAFGESESHPPSQQNLEAAQAIEDLQIELNKVLKVLCMVMTSRANNIVESKLSYADTHYKVTSMSLKTKNRPY